jgi:hypothetical protein
VQLSFDKMMEISLSYKLLAHYDEAKEIKLKLLRLCTSNKVVKVLITSTTLTLGLIIY